MAREVLTDDQIEAEIARLRESPDVKLAQLENRIRYKRRQYLYQLRFWEKRGREMAASGITEEMLRQLDADGLTLDDIE